MTLSSASYEENGIINAKYCLTRVEGGKNISPQFSWQEAPEKTKSFVLSIIDKHPIASNWVHWIIADIPADIDSLEEGVSNTADIPDGSIELINTFGTHGYGGPCPPSGSGDHNYTTRLYALNIPKIGLSGKVSEADLLKKIKSNILAQVEYTGFFGR